MNRNPTPTQIYWNEHTKFYYLKLGWGDDVKISEKVYKALVDVYPALKLVGKVELKD